MINNIFGLSTIATKTHILLTYNSWHVNLNTSLLACCSSLVTLDLPLINLHPWHATLCLTCKFSLVTPDMLLLFCHSRHVSIHMSLLTYHTLRVTLDISPLPCSLSCIFSLGSSLLTFHIWFVTLDSLLLTRFSWLVTLNLSIVHRGPQEIDVHHFVLKSWEFLR